jgi:hypothetical protein
MSDSDLLQMTDYEKKAAFQLNDVLARSNDDPLLLTGTEWKRFACLWRCIKSGLHIPHLSAKHEKWLRSRPGRLEAEKIAQRMNLTIEECADLAGAEFEDHE